MIREKRGWIRVLEVFIAILLLLSFLLTMYAKQQEKVNIKDKIYEIQDSILKEISSNETLREYVLSENKDLENFIRSRLPPSFEFKIKICKINENCIIEEKPIEKEIYVDDILISSTLKKYEPKKLALFCWIK